MKKIIYLCVVAISLMFSSCVDLDIPPKTILYDEDIYNPTGIEAYMAGMYSRIPMDDFNVSGNGNGNKQGYYGNWEAFRWPMISTGETVNRHEKGLYLHCGGYWREGWKVIRDANRLIDNLPAYIGKISGVEAWIAEAKFVRAYVYFAMAKRYGGLPIMQHVQDFDPDFEKLNVARSSCKDTYDFILADLTAAEQGMKKDKSLQRANSYIATAMKSKVALFAASIAKYGTNYIYEKNGIMLCGIPATEADYYYKMSWESSRALEGIYSLLGVGEKNPEAQEKNFENVFVNANSSPETIFLRKYDVTAFPHSFDVVYGTPRMATEGGDRYGITLDWMELFDGKYFNDEENSGKLDLVYKGSDGASYYKVFDNPGQLYEGAEPRLRASILIPGNKYTGGVLIDMRKGVLKDDILPAVPIKKLTIDDYVTHNGFDNPVQPGRDYFLKNISRLTSNNRPMNQTGEDMYETIGASGEKVKLYKNGLDGPGTSLNGATLTGIQGRKWLDLSLANSAVSPYKSSQSWIDIRYAEILLNRAEAALELYQNGTASVSYNGEAYNTRTDAFNCINDIRQRGGAELLASENELSEDPAYNRPASAIQAGVAYNPGKGGFIYGPNRGIQIVRVERYKELAFEHKVYWDLRRWFSFHVQIHKYKRRGLYPFMFAKEAFTSFDGTGKEVPSGKYIYDSRICEQATNELNFPINGTGTQTYYEYIPGGELSKNPLLEGNKGQ